MLRHNMSGCLFIEEHCGLSSIEYLISMASTWQIRAECQYRKDSVAKSLLQLHAYREAQGLQSQYLKNWPTTYRHLALQDSWA